MKRDYIDFNRIDDLHHQVHEDLMNWKGWVQVREPVYTNPMFRQYRSHSWQWHTPEFRRTCDILHAQKVEKMVCSLPELHRIVLQWWYVYPAPPWKIRKHLGVTEEKLYQLLYEARSMIKVKLS